ncbi:MAG: hypothetical protein MZU95_06015 [Desulfomicrobium escambiense]|nr:hypothetical protein [Desulfomicrobium escambiense]
MASCVVCGKTRTVGQNVSHANNKTKESFSRTYRGSGFRRRAGSGRNMSARVASARTRSSRPFRPRRLSGCGGLIPHPPAVVGGNPALP